MARPGVSGVDPYLVAERWLELVASTLAEYRDEHHRARYILLRNTTPSLKSRPLSNPTAEAFFVDLPAATPLEARVNACILGVPDLT